MAYSHISWIQLRQALAARLGDTSNTFWLDDENAAILTEALRTFGLLSGFWRERGTISTAANTAFYDIPSNLSGSLLNYTVTDRTLIKKLQYDLLESVASQSSWGGTEMFTLDDLTKAIERRINQFLQDTGIIVTHTTGNLPPPPIGRLQLSDNVVDVRRFQWVDSSGRYYNVWVEDEVLLTSFDPSWPVNGNVPFAYSVLATQPVSIQIAPPPISSGTYDLVSVNTHAALDPSTVSTTLQIFDDLTPIIKWGALADLLGKDGIARDPIRSMFCEQRYKQGVMLTRLLGSVVHSRINDVAVTPITLADLDAWNPGWQSEPAGKPTDLALAGWNLLCANPVPDGVYSISLDVIRKAPIPNSDNDYVQLGREQIDAILDYAEHLALFKVGGAEFDATQRQAEIFIAEALTYNQRLSASARSSLIAAMQGQNEKHPRPRRLEAAGLGTLNARS